MPVDGLVSYKRFVATLLDAGTGNHRNGLIGPAIIHFATPYSRKHYERRSVEMGETKFIVVVTVNQL